VSDELEDCSTVAHTYVLPVSLDKVNS